MFHAKPPCLTTVKRLWPLWRLKNDSASIHIKWLEVVFKPETPVNAGEKGFHTCKGSMKRDLAGCIITYNVELFSGHDTPRKFRTMETKATLLCTVLLVLYSTLLSMYRCILLLLKTWITCINAVPMRATLMTIKE